MGVGVGGIVMHFSSFFSSFFCYLQKGIWTTSVPRSHNIRYWSVSVLLCRNERDIFRFGVVSQMHSEYQSSIDYLLASVFCILTT